MNAPEILNITFYKFVALTNENAPRELKPQLRKFAVDAGVLGTILLAPEGINGQIAGPREAVAQFWKGLTSFDRFADLERKESLSDKMSFERLKIKLKPAVIPMRLGDRNFNIEPAQKTGRRIHPLELKTWMDGLKDFHLIDTRNDYEIAFGTFKTAKHYGVKHFQNFVENLEANKENLKDKPVVMFCTGGIRCEKATALAQHLGIEDVYQLDGGILKYFEEVGGAHYEGTCFVFDERISVRTDLKPV